MITLFIITGIFAILTIYLLNTDMDKWIFGLGGYCEQLLEIFPKAQYWINNSPVFREKLVLIYVIHYLLQWIIVMGMTVAMIHGYNHHHDRFIMEKKFPILISCNKIGKLIFVFGVPFFFYIYFLQVRADKDQSSINFMKI